MNKEIARKYLKAKHEVAKYVYLVEHCEKIISEFNKELKEVDAKCDEYQYNINRRKSWQDQYNAVDKTEFSGYENLSVEQKIRM